MRDRVAQAALCDQSLWQETNRANTLSRTMGSNIGQIGRQNKIKICADRYNYGGKKE